MDREMVYEAVVAAIDDLIGDAPKSINKDSKLCSFEFDSLDSVQLMLDIEEQLGIEEIDSEKFGACKTVGDLVDLVMQTKEKPNGSDGEGTEEGEKPAETPEAPESVG